MCMMVSFTHPPPKGSCRDGKGFFILRKLFKFARERAYPDRWSRPYNSMESCPEFACSTALIDNVQWFSWQTARFILSLSHISSPFIFHLHQRISNIHFNYITLGKYTAAIIEMFFKYLDYCSSMSLLSLYFMIKYKIY